MCHIILLPLPSCRYRSFGCSSVFCWLTNVAGAHVGFSIYWNIWPQYQSFNQQLRMHSWPQQHNGMICILCPFLELVMEVRYFVLRRRHCASLFYWRAFCLFFFFFLDLYSLHPCMYYFFIEKQCKYVDVTRYQPLASCRSCIAEIRVRKEAANPFMS